MRILAIAMFAVASTVWAQSEADLRSYFEGKNVLVKLDMPANKAGIDVFPELTPSLNYADYASRLKRYGISLQRNDVVTVTKIKVKDKNIEFQLGGGGYGTAGDPEPPSVYIPDAEKTQREKNLERDVKIEKDPAKKKQMQADLDDMRRRRERENARIRVAVAQAEVERQEIIRRRAASAGSRFNLVFKNGVPTDALKPEYLVTALKEWVDLDPNVASHPTPPPEVPRLSLRKGLTEPELRSLLGEPAKRERKPYPDFAVEVLTYKPTGSTIEVTMVEGVLVRFRQWSD